MGAVSAIAINTFRETIRNKILYTIILFILIVLISGNYLANISMHNEDRIIMDIGLGMLSLFGVFLTVFTGINIIFKEIDKKTIYLVLSKPLNRTGFILGKLFGLLLAVYTVVIIMFAILMAQSLLMQIAYPVNLVKGFILILFEILIVLSIAIFFSSFTTPFITGMLTVGIIIVGRLLPDLHQIIRVKYVPGFWRETALSLTQIFPNLYIFVPNGHDFNGQYLSLTSDFITWNYISWAFLYTVFYSSITLVLASTILKNRDLV
ncbi:MAG: ABC transporter permease [Myxococcota bacterium]